MNIWERQPAEETPLVETLAEVPQLLDEPPSGAPKKRKSRGPMSPEHKQALMAGKERARAAREQADRERAHVSMTAACEVPPVDDVAKVEPAVVGNDAPQPATIDVLPAALSPATGTWISWPSAPEGQWRGVVARECPTSAFNLTSSARRLLMDALAAREPIVRLTPLIAWVQSLEAEASA